MEANAKSFDNLKSAESQPALPELSIQTEAVSADPDFETMPTIETGPVGLSQNLEPKSGGKFETVRNWVRKRKLSLAIGASVLSLGTGLAVNPAEKTLHEVENRAEWVVPAEIGLDASIGVGAVMMLAATGTMIKNPFKAKQHLKELPQKANDSLIFKSGLVISTIGGVGWGGVAMGAIMTCLPPEAWGSLAFPAADLASTFALRRMIWTGIRSAEQAAQLEQ